MENIAVKRKGKELARIAVMCLILAALMIAFMHYEATSVFAEEDLGYRGVPEVSLTLDPDTLDESGNLIYVGVDFGVFVYDEEKGGYVAKEGKIKRILTTSTTIDVDLGDDSDYKKGVKHKLAYRTLYVPAGTKQEPIIVANESDANEGWNSIEGSLFTPTYFYNFKTGESFINHTEKWLINIDTYNASKVSASRSSEQRSVETFWSGEKLLLYIKTKEELPYLEMILDGTYKTVLDAYTRDGEFYIYESGSWNEGMLNKWGNYIPKTVPYTLNVKESASGAVLESYTGEILFDNRDLFYRVHKVY